MEAEPQKNTFVPQEHNDWHDIFGKSGRSHGEIKVNMSFAIAVGKMQIVVEKGVPLPRKTRLLTMPVPIYHAAQLLARARYCYYCRRV